MTWRKGQRAIEKRKKTEKAQRYSRRKTKKQIQKDKGKDREGVQIGERGTQNPREGQRCGERMKGAGNEDAEGQRETQVDTETQKAGGDRGGGGEL